uniref:Uncharacterized protein n=1 Tax=Arundo donax TaxID=35708 RepID=A0A0A9GJG9_ARUDO
MILLGIIIFYFWKLPKIDCIDVSRGHILSFFCL